MKILTIKFGQKTYWIGYMLQVNIMFVLLIKFGKQNDKRFLENYIKVQDYMESKTNR